MTPGSLVQISLLLLCLGAAVGPLGSYMARVYQGEAVWLTRLLGPLESLFYRLAGVRAAAGMSWKQYLLAVLILSSGGIVLLYLMLLAQGFLPWNPLHLPGLDPDLAFNVAVSFVTNTDWQAYGSAPAISPLVNCFGLLIQHFLSASVGIAVLIAFIRGLAGRERRDLGNFWADIVRGNLYILLPLSLVLAIMLASQGVVQSLHSRIDVPLLEATAEKSVQRLGIGPVASMEAIKQLGSNGGGFFDANAAHPFENPTLLTNFVGMFAILLIPAALCCCFGVMVSDRRQGWALLATMLLIFLPLAVFTNGIEQRGNPFLAERGIDQAQSFTQPGGNMEGKEMRFGIAGSSLWTVTTAAGANASVNNLHSSLTPLGGMVPLLLMQTGEAVFGGVGSGLYTMMLAVVVAVFVGGLMVGRTPEYLGKKIQSFEIRMTSIAILVPAATVLLGTALAVSLTAGRAGLLHDGPHGFTELLYSFSSTTSGSGSAFNGINVDSPFYNTIFGIAMLLGRFWVMIPVLAIAGSLGSKRIVPANRGTLPTHTPLFVVMLAASILLISVLTYIPALTLGPIVEHLQLSPGTTP